jgi:hypothetical protein
MVFLTIVLLKSAQERIGIHMARRLARALAGMVQAYLRPYCASSCTHDDICKTSVAEKQPEDIRLRSDSQSVAGPMTDTNFLCTLILRPISEGEAGNFRYSQR